MLQAKDLSKKFGYFTVFENIYFDLQEGSLTYLQGKNGQGKTTLLKTLAHIFPPTAGEILWQGRKITDSLIDYRKKLFFLSSENSLYNSLNALENIHFFLSFYQKVKTKEIMEVLEEFHLEKFTKIPINYFSTGMKKKLLLVLMKLQKPKLLLLDEPYSGLDKKGQEIFSELLKKIHTQGAMILLVSHQSKNYLPFTNCILQLEHQKLKNIPLDKILLD